jgi:hypothetical protein
MRRHHWRHFSHRDARFDPSDLVDSLHDVIEAAIDAGMDSLYALQDRTSWKADDLCDEARAFAGRFSAHPSWRSAWERTSRAWSDTD